MKTLNRINRAVAGLAIKLFCIVTGILLLNGCEDDKFSFQEPKRQVFMMDMLRQDTSLSIMVQALDKANMSATLNTYGPFTLFAPDNNAFRKYFKARGKKGLEDFTADEIKFIMVYHLMGARLKSIEFIQGPQPVTTGNKDYITLDISKGFKSNTVANGIARVYETDIEFSNGLVHKIDAVLDPPNQTIGQFLMQNQDKYSIMIGGLQRAGLMDTLTNLENEKKERISLTLFAETNDVLQKAGVTSFDNVPLEELKSQMRYHIIPGRGFSSSYTRLTTAIPHLGWPERWDSTLTTLSWGQWIYADLAAKHLLNSTVDFTASDVLLRNGLLHNVSGRLVFDDKVVKRTPIFHLFKNAQNYGYGIPNYTNGALAVVASGTNWRITSDGDDVPAANSGSIKRTGIFILFANWDTPGADSIVTVVKGVKKGKYLFRLAFKNGGRGSLQMMHNDDLIGTPQSMNIANTGTTYSNKEMGVYEFTTSGDKRIKFVCTATPGVALENMVLIPVY